MQRIFQNKDKPMLENLYLRERLSMNEIGRRFGTSHNTISRTLKRMGMPPRSLAERYDKNHVMLSRNAVEFISGELLGDMYLSNRSSLASAIGYASKFRGYILFLRDILREFGIEGVGEIKEYKDSRYGTSIHRYSSREYPELLDIRNIFYPSGKKIIPNMEFTPIILRQWYIGDGTNCQDKYGNHHMKIAACAFSNDDVAKAVEKINSLGIRARHHARNIIYISPKSANDFLNYIGPCPVQCYSYKWATINRPGQLDMVLKN